MSETIYGYTINYVIYRSPIDHENYNNLVSAIVAFLEAFWSFYGDIASIPGYPGITNYYHDNSGKISKFLEDVNKDRYKAERLTPVYPYHYQDLKDILMIPALGIRTIFTYLEQEEFEIPIGMKVALDGAISILTRYPVLKPETIIEPKHHNDILMALKLLRDVFEDLVKVLDMRRVLGPLRTYVYNVWDKVEYWRYAFTEYFKIFERGLTWWRCGFEDWRDFDYTEPVLYVKAKSPNMIRITVEYVEAIFVSELWYGNIRLTENIHRAVGQTYIIYI